MKVKSINLHNFRSFKSASNIELSDINILIGENNSGKSSILRGLHHLQIGLNNTFEDVRVNSALSQITIYLKDAHDIKIWENFDVGPNPTFRCQLESTDRRGGSCHYVIDGNSNSKTSNDPNEVLLHNNEPNHFIIPFFSKRKTGYYQEDVKEAHVTRITSDVSNLAAKLSRIANPSFPQYQLYANACKEILGFVITAIPSLNGHRPGVYLPDESIIFIEQMGEGVPNIVSLLVSLALSKNKLFLIEEPENDLHPHALKALLDLMKESSKHNQFVISTHSNIVVTHLCSEKNSKLFKITCERGILPTTASIQEIGNNSRERIQVLQELGYSFSDYDLWEGWLLLEESSAERIIRDYLIPCFTPRLGRIKTIAAGGIDNVEPMFKDLFRVVLFTHLQQVYSDLAWVRVDGDDIGRQSILKLHEKFPSISKDNFSTFDKPQFEYYYPHAFQQRVLEILNINDKQERREAKRILLNDVIDWLDADSDRARHALEESAISVINELKIIEQQFLARRLG